AAHDRLSLCDRARGDLADREAAADDPHVRGRDDRRAEESLVVPGERDLDAPVVRELLDAARRAVELVAIGADGRAQLRADAHVDTAGLAVLEHDVESERRGRQWQQREQHEEPDQFELEAQVFTGVADRTVEEASERKEGSWGESQES